MPLKELQDVAASLLLDQIDMVSYTPRDNSNLMWAHEESSKLSADVKSPILRYDQKITIGRVKGLVAVHVTIRAENIDCKTRFDGGVASAAQEAKTADKVGVFGDIKGVPSQLIGDLSVLRLAPGGMPRQLIRRYLEWFVDSSGQYAIQP